LITYFDGYAGNFSFASSHALHHQWRIGHNSNVMPRMAHSTTDFKSNQWHGSETMNQMPGRSDLHKRRKTVHGPPLATQDKLQDDAGADIVSYSEFS
jgi:hypothetical protein